MKKLLLIVLIAIVVISCKKEEITEIVPIQQNQYVKINANDFPLGLDLPKIFVVKDNGVINTSFNFIINCPLTISAPNDSLIKITLPKSFSIIGDSLITFGDTVFEFNTHKFITNNNKTYINVYPYIIYAPVLNPGHMSSLKIEYKRNDIPKSRSIVGSINCK